LNHFFRFLVASFLHAAPLALEWFVASGIITKLLCLHLTHLFDIFLGPIKTRHLFLKKFEMSRHQFIERVLQEVMHLSPHSLALDKTGML